MSKLRSIELGIILGTLIGSIIGFAIEKHNQRRTEVEGVEERSSDCLVLNLARHFKDKEGNIVIAQWPNKPLWAALIFFSLKYFPNTALQNISLWGFIFSLLYWSYLEIFYGVNSWRRSLGLIVSIGIVYKLLGKITL